MADGFDPAEFEAFKARTAAPPTTAEAFNPADFAAFKANSGAADRRAAPASADPAFGEYAGLPVGGDLADMAKTAPASLARGAMGLAGLPADAMNLVDRAWQNAAAFALEKAGALTPEQAEGIKQPMPGIDGPDETRMRGVFPTSGLLRDGTDAVLDRVGLPELYKPKTTAGRFVNAAGEFIPGAGRALPDIIMRGVIPGLASEGAGQLTEGSALETPARIIAGLGAGLAGSAVRAPSRAGETVAARAQGATAEQVDRAEALFQDAAARGLPLTRANALDAVTNGVTSLSDLQRVVEGNGRLRGFFAPTADGVRREGQDVLDTVARASDTPAVLGGEVQDAARRGVAQTPEGMALSEAVTAGGPRVTPEQAGEVIQPALTRVRDRREGMRAALAERDYRAAEQSPETVGIERTVPVERLGEPIVTQAQYSRPQFTDAAPAPLGPPPGRGDGAPVQAGPESLARFIARNGGIRLDGDAAATDLQRFNIPGHGNVARPTGKGIDDFWRERLIEEGYFKPDADGGMARDISNELLRKLQNEQRGFPSYPIGSNRLMGTGPTAGQLGDEYAAALSHAETRLDGDLRGAGIDPASVHPDVRSRTLGALIRGEAKEPLDAYERTVGAMREQPAPFVKSTTVQEQIPDVRFGQANPQAVVDHIDEALRTAKGPVAKALTAARDTLFTRAEAGAPRELDLSVAGLHGARDAIGDMVAKAEPTTQRALLGVRDRLDRALSTVPEYEHARSGFEVASRPLDPFAPGSAPGSIVARDQASGRHAMAPENVPAALDAGPSAGRAFKDVAPDEARAAYEGHMRTALLDHATDAATGEVSSGRIRELLRANEDGLRQFPAVREHLERVAFAREGREAVDRSPLGRIAGSPIVQNAVEALFPAGAKGTSAKEVGEAVRRMAANNPRAASELVRMHMEQVFDQATRTLQSGPNQAGGTKFAAALVGHSKEAASMEAAVKALPGGETTWSGIRRLLDIFDAQGWRQAIGSGTSFNNAIMSDLGKGKTIEEAGSAVLTGGIKLPTRIMDKIEGWRMGRGLDEMARLFTDPRMAGTFRRLATEPQGSGLARLTTIAVDRAMRGYGADQGGGESSLQAPGR